MKVQYIYLKEDEIKDEIDFQWDRLLKKYTKMYGTENTPCVADVTVHKLNDTTFEYEVDDYSDCLRFAAKEKIFMKKTSNTIEIRKENCIYDYEFDECTNETEMELIIFTQICDGIGVDEDKLKKLQKNHEDYHKQDNKDKMIDFE